MIYEAELLVSSRPLLELEPPDAGALESERHWGVRYTRIEILDGHGQPVLATGPTQVIVVECGTMGPARPRSIGQDVPTLNEIQYHGDIMF